MNVCTSVEDAPLQVPNSHSKKKLEASTSFSLLLVNFKCPDNRHGTKVYQGTATT